MRFGALIRKMTDAACNGDGRRVATCFMEDGIYDDVFYGIFKGHNRIEEMINGYFHRDACNFLWDIHNPVTDGKTGYVRYIFSYESKLRETLGQRTIFEGVAIVTLEKDRIKLYKEIANVAPGLQRMGFDLKRIGRFMEKQIDELVSRDEARRHI